MTPTPEERDALFRAFGRAFFRQDLDAMYRVVTEDFTYSIMLNGLPRRMTSREQVAAFFEERRGIEKDLRFEDIVFHHARDATFMTCRVTGTDVATGEPFERLQASSAMRFATGALPRRTSTTARSSRLRLEPPHPFVS